MYEPGDFDLPSMNSGSLIRANADPVASETLRSFYCEKGNLDVETVEVWERWGRESVNDEVK